MHKTKCTDRQATYTGKTGRNLKTRLTEHKRATKNSNIRNQISEHHRLTKHKIDWYSAECVTCSTNYQQRLTLEIWCTNSKQEPLIYTWPPSNETHTPQQTIDGSKITANNSRTITATFTFWQPNPSRQNWPIQITTRGINAIIWRRLFAWLWRWLPLR